MNSFFLLEALLSQPGADRSLAAPLAAVPDIRRIMSKSALDLPAWSCWSDELHIVRQQALSWQALGRPQGTEAKRDAPSQDNTELTTVSLEADSLRGMLRFHYSLWRENQLDAHFTAHAALVAKAGAPVQQTLPWGDIDKQGRMPLPGQAQSWSLTTAGFCHIGRSAHAKWKPMDLREAATAASQPAIWLPGLWAPTPSIRVSRQCCPLVPAVRAATCTLQAIQHMGQGVRKAMRGLEAVVAGNLKPVTKSTWGGGSFFAPNAIAPLDACLLGLSASSEPERVRAMLRDSHAMTTPFDAETVAAASRQAALESWAAWCFFSHLRSARRKPPRDPTSVWRTVAALSTNPIRAPLPRELFKAVLDAESGWGRRRHMLLWGNAKSRARVSRPSVGLPYVTDLRGSTAEQ